MEKLAASQEPRDVAGCTTDLRDRRLNQVLCFQSASLPHIYATLPHEIGEDAMSSTWRGVHGGIGFDQTEKPFSQELRPVSLGHWIPTMLHPPLPLPGRGSGGEHCDGWLRMDEIEVLSSVSSATSG